MKKWLIIFCTLLFLMPGVEAEEYNEKNIISEQFEASGVNDLETEGTQEIAPDFSFSESAAKIAQGDIESPFQILKNALTMLISETKKNINMCMKILLISLCLGVISNFVQENEKIIDAAFYVCYMVVFTMVIGSFTSIVEIAKDAITTMDIFMRSAIPVLGGLMTASGGAAKTAMIGANIIGISSAVSILGGVVLPAAVFTALLGGVNNLSDKFNLNKVSAAVKKAVVWTLGIVMTIFAAIISTRSFAAAGIDNVAKRTIKYAVGKLVPFVGGVMSETLESVLACGKLVKTAAGAAGVIAVLYICLAPVVKILSVLIVYKITSLIITPMCDRRISGVVDEMSSALTIVLALVVASGIMFVICTGIIAAV